MPAYRRQAVQEKPLKAFFAFIGFSEATSSPCRPELDNGKAKGGPLRGDKRWPP
ncbi:hypothetical protein [Siminovitchia fortis]|uniref:hypothetical protein n=1 Tax=Siminovitchia fortis TaxID=254758 RepID=UPI001642DFBB|nr:hypothetical protein [Siminovitchia fortis]